MKNLRHTAVLISLLILLIHSSLKAQVNSSTENLSMDKHGFFYPADSFNNVRFYTALSSGVVGYSATLYGLSKAWYSQYDKSPFHFYDDFGVWRNMDKYGHAYTTYFYTDLLHRMSNWTGLEDRKSLWLSYGAANFFQLTLEVLDGFNSEWGFSPSDIAANTIGSSIYLAQHLLWKEQRIRLKFSSFPQKYSNVLVPSAPITGTMSYRDRADDLYGTDFASRLLKDYNGQTYWLSVNLASFNIPHPEWLNWAIGVSAADMYGGESNEWIKDNITYTAPFPQRSVFYLSPDINWDAFRTRKGGVGSTFLGMLNYIKVPLPAISIDTRGTVGWHLIFF